MKLHKKVNIYNLLLEKCVAIWKNVELLCFLLYSLQANLLGRRFKRVVVQKLYKNREGVSIKKRGNHLNIKQLPLCGAPDFVIVSPKNLRQRV